MSSPVLVCIFWVDVGSKVLSAFLMLTLKIPQGVQMQNIHSFTTLCQNFMADFYEAMNAMHIYTLGSPQLGQSNSSGCCVIARHDIRVFFVLLFC